ncbi:MAG: hypothetical protein ACXAC2_07460 [Candidatus Kariarchaeaceae archaeon]|jgi:hypothetical protein
MKKNGIIIIFLTGILVLLSGCTGPLITTYDSIGNGTPVQLETNLYNSVELEITNEIGKVDIRSETDTNYAVSVILSVFSRNTDTYTLENAEELTTTTPEANKTKISFISNPDNLGIPNYKYEITIVVNTAITLAMDIDLTTGSITLDLKDSVLSELNLVSTTGFKDITITNCEIADSAPFVDGTTGGTDISLINLNFTVITDWTISSSTGVIDMIINGLESINGTHAFDITATTGDVQVNTALSGIGFKVTASTSLGTITLPGGSDSPYLSPDYASAGVKIDFGITVTTGSVTVTT